MPKIDPAARSASNVAGGRTAGGVQVVQDVPKFSPSPIDMLDTTPANQRPDYSALAAGKGPMRQQQSAPVPADTPVIQTPTASQVDASLDITQQVDQQGVPDETSIASSSVEYAKNYALQAGANTMRGSADFAGTLDGLAGMVTRKMGMPKPQALAIMEESANHWAQHLENKMSFHDYMTNVVGGVLGSAPEVVQFMMGPEWAALRAVGDGQDLPGAIKAYAQRAAAGAVFKSAHTLDAPARIAAGTAYMTGENAAGQLAATGAVDAVKLGEAAGTGLGMMLTGGVGPGNKAGLRQRIVSPEQWVGFSDVGKEIDRAYESKEITTDTRDLAYFFYSADLVRGGSALSDTSLKVVNVVKEIKKDVDAALLRDQGIDPAKAKDGELIISGKTTTKGQLDGTYKTAIELYLGHRPDTLVEEWMHRQYNYLKSSERAAVSRAYDAYKSGLSESGQPMSIEEFYAKGATDKFFADQVAAQKSADRPAWTKAVSAARDRWDSIVKAVRGVPGAGDEMPGGSARIGKGDEYHMQSNHVDPLLDGQLGEWAGVDVRAEINGKESTAKAGELANALRSRMDELRKLVECLG